MTLGEMLSYMGILLGDVEENEFPRAVRVNMLNDAQDELLRHLSAKNALDRLTELRKKVSDQVTDNEGKFYLGSLSDAIYGADAGIKAIRLQDGSTDGVPVGKISEEEWRRDYLNIGRTFISSRPKYVPIGKYIYVKPYNSGDIASGDISAGTDYVVVGYSSVTYNGVLYATGDVFTGATGVTTYTSVGTGSVIIAQYIDIEYIKQPSTMALGSAVAGDTSCSLDSSRHSIIIGLAIAGFGTARAQEYTANAWRKIKELRMLVPKTDSMFYDDDDYDPDAFTNQGIYVASGSTTTTETDMTKIVQVMTAGVGGVAAYDLVYVSADGIVLPADASARTTARVFGIAESAIAEGAEGNITTNGLVENPLWSWTLNGTNENLLRLSGTTNKLAESVPAAGKYDAVCAIVTSTTKVNMITVRAVTQVL